MLRHTRYQGAIVRDHHVLLLRHREHATGHSYWVMPGGGIEPGESEAECVCREMREETHLEVAVERLLLREPGVVGDVYQQRNTYLCRVLSGEARPGHEPEIEAAAHYGIVEVAWFDLRDPAGWGEAVISDRITYPLLLQIRAALGYDAG